MRESRKKGVSKIKQANESVLGRRPKAYDYGVGFRHNSWFEFLSSEQKGYIDPVGVLPLLSGKGKTASQARETQVHECGASFLPQQ